jgi:hypothetical protein
MFLAGYSAMILVPRDRLVAGHIGSRDDSRYALGSDLSLADTRCRSSLHWL